MIIGIGGELESGKSTVANFITEEYNYTEMSFAENLKLMCMYIFNLTRDQCFTTKGKQEIFDNAITLTQEHAVKIIKWIHTVNHYKLEEINTKVVEQYIGNMKFSTPRSVLQLIGTEICRESVNADFHVEVVYKKIKEQNLKDVVISDARFFNEREYIKSKGGMTLLVVNTQDIKKDERFSHGSEVEIGSAKDYDCTIFNDKDSLLILKEQTNQAYRDLLRTT